MGKTDMKYLQYSANGAIGGGGGGQGQEVGMADIFQTTFVLNLHHALFN